MNFSIEEMKLIRERAKKGMITPFELEEETLVVMPLKLYATLSNNTTSMELPDTGVFEKLKRGEK